MIKSINKIKNKLNEGRGVTSRFKDSEGEKQDEQKAYERKGTSEGIVTNSPSWKHNNQMQQQTSQQLNNF